MDTPENESQSPLPDYEGLHCGVDLEFPRKGWYPAVVDTLVEMVRSLPAWSRFSTIHLDHGVSSPLTPERFDTVVRDVSNPAFRLDGGDDTDIELHFSRFHGTRAMLWLRMLNAHYRSSAHELQAALETFASTFGEALVASTSRIDEMFMPPLVPQPLGRLPPSGAVGYTRFADAFDRRIPAMFPDKPRGRVVARLLAAPVPDAVRRVEAGDVVLLFWTDDLTNREALVRAALSRRRWMKKSLADLSL